MILAGVLVTIGKKPSKLPVEPGFEATYLF
jgi:hypothetical protein